MVGVCPMIDMEQVFSVAGAPTPSSGPGGPHSVPVRWIYAKLWWKWASQALLDAEWVEVRCVHGDIHKYPLVALAADKVSGQNT